MPRRVRLLATYLAHGYRLVDARVRGRRLRVRVRKGLVTVVLDLDRDDAWGVLTAPPHAIL